MFAMFILHDFKDKTGKYFLFSAVVLSPQVPPTGHVLWISLIKNCCPDCLLKHMCKMKENLQTWPVWGGFAIGGQA